MQRIPYACGTKLVVPDGAVIDPDAIEGYAQLPCPICACRMIELSSRPKSEIVVMAILMAQIELQIATKNVPSEGLSVSLTLVPGEETEISVLESCDGHGQN